MKLSTRMQYSFIFLWSTSSNILQLLKQKLCAVNKYAAKLRSYKGGVFAIFVMNIIFLYSDNICVSWNNSRLSCHAKRLEMLVNQCKINHDPNKLATVWFYFNNSVLTGSVSRDIKIRFIPHPKHKKCIICSTKKTCVASCMTVL